MKDPMRKRELVGVILLSIFTFGIYELVWTYKNLRGAAAALQRPAPMGAWIASLITFIVQILLVIPWIIFQFWLPFSMASNPSGPAVGAIIFIVLGFIVFIVVVLAHLVCRALTLYTTGNLLQDVLRTRQLQPALPPALHFLTLAVGVWPIVAIAIMQSDVNKFFDANVPTGPRPVYTTAPPTGG